jgi:hypothetical protein
VFGIGTNVSISPGYNGYDPYDFISGSEETFSLGWRHQPVRASLVLVGVPNRN